MAGLAAAGGGGEGMPHLAEADSLPMRLHSMARPQRVMRHADHRGSLGAACSYNKSVKNIVGKGGRRWYKSVGLGIKTPKEAIEGEECPVSAVS